MKTLRTSMVAAGLIFCSGLVAQTPTVSGDNMLCPDGFGTVTTQTYDSYQWLRRYYGSTVTNPVPGETNQSLVMNYYDYAASYISVETTLGGVVDTSDEFFVDGWVFSGAYVISSGDFTIGMSGESILCPGATMYFELGNPYSTNITWYKDGDPIPGETSQTLTVTQPGVYYVEGAPAVCPDFIQGPGVSLEVDVLSFSAPVVTVSGDHTVEAGTYILCGTDDEVILEIENPYNTNITWFESGNPIGGATTQTLTITDPGIYSASAAPAECPDYVQNIPDTYTVENCGLGFGETEAAALTVYPNPANVYVMIQVPDELVGSTFELQDQTGRVVANGQLQNTVTTLETGHLSSGIYLLRVAGKTTQRIAVKTN